MGSLRPIITAVVDIHDTDNMPFASLQALYELANIVTYSKIRPIKVQFWKDDAREDVVCSFAFEGWLAGFHISGGGGANHMLSLRLEAVS